MLRERNATCVQGWELRNKLEPIVQPSSPLCHSIAEVGELPVPWRRPSSRLTAHLISTFPPPEESKVFHTTLIARLEGREGGGRKQEVGAPAVQGHSPTFPCSRLIVAPTRTQHAEREGERDIAPRTESGPEMKQEGSQTLGTRRPLHLPSVTPTQHKGVERLRHVSAPISSSAHTWSQHHMHV